MMQGCIPHLPEKLVVLGVGSRPTALDVINPHPVQRPGDEHLVLDRKGYADGLGAVPEGRIVDGDVPAAHVLFTVVLFDW